MNRALVDPIAQAVLYEGYVLYPYRPALKNRQRWTFGGLLPEADDPARSIQRTVCLLAAAPGARLEVLVRFLHLTDRRVGALEPPCPDRPEDAENAFRTVDALWIGDQLYQTWQEAVEREVALEPTPLGSLCAGTTSVRFAFPGGQSRERLTSSEGRDAGEMIREQATVEGLVETEAAEVDPGLYRLTIRVQNQSGSEPGGASRHGVSGMPLTTLASTHTIVAVDEGAFVSLRDPPARWRSAAGAAARDNREAWPVLIGHGEPATMMLSASIILDDFPRVAPESPVVMCDGTEIDEMLTLRILTLTDEEKQAMAALDERTRRLLERIETLEQEPFLRLHGTVRERREVPAGGDR